MRRPNIWRAPACRNSFEDLVNHTVIVYGETAMPEIRDVNWLLDATRRLAPGGVARALRINN